MRDGNSGSKRWETRGVVSWDIRLERTFHPFYALGAGYQMDDGIPPCDVKISVTFDDNAKALEFQSKVLKLMEEYGA